MDDGTLNAGAFQFEKEYVIFVNTGAMGLLSLYFTRVLADGRLFLDIGQPELERTDLAQLGELVPDATKLNEAFSKLAVPISQERVDYSFGLTMHAFGFLFAHELGHVMNGHVALFAAEHHFVYSELNRFEGSMSDVQADRQALEMDADSAAVFQELEQLFFKIADAPDLDPLHKSDIHLNPEKALFFWFFAVFSIFRFFGDRRFTALDLRTTPYPPPRMRQLLAIGSAQGYVAYHSKRPDLASVCKETGGKALLAVEEAFSIVTGTPTSVDGLKNAMSHTNDHGKLIWEYFRQKVRPRLERFTHVPLAV